MIAFLDTLFSWPNGITVGNLCASAIWGVPAFTLAVWHHRKVIKEVRKHHHDNR